MNKLDLVREVAKYSGYSQPVVKEILEVMVATIRYEVARTGLVRIGGLGKFQRVYRRPILVSPRDFATGKRQKMRLFPARNMVKFTPSETFSNAMPPPEEI